MLIEIEKIKVSDRIRKDFGNLQELADDIKENGLINPPVVTPENDGSFTLLAGERRVKAMKNLGYKQIEVRTWISLNEEQRLNVEISENEVRKDFSKAERIEYARRLEKIESLKAKERIINPTQNFVEGQKGETVDIVANKLGIGSGETYRKEKYIVENKDLLSSEDFENWDESKLSTNKAFNKIKDKMSSLTEENKELNQKLNKLSSLQVEINQLKQEIDDRPIIEKEVNPSDYDSTKKILDNYKKDYKNLQKQFEDKIHELNQVKRDLETIKQNTPEEQYNKKIKDSTIFFCARISEFLEKVGGYIWIVEHINELPEYEKKSYISAVNAIFAWAENLINNIK